MATPTALRVLERNARVYAKTWRGSAFSTILSPLLFLVAMGLGLGQLVDEGTGTASLGDLPYIVFLAPGLLAASAMQNGAGDSSWPVMMGMKWAKHYDVALNTPLATRDLVYGHFGWVAVRLAGTSVIFVAIMTLFGAVDLVRGLLAIFPAVLTGLAFAGPLAAYAAQLENDTGLSSVFRFVITPLYLFSGTFFPITQLPDWMEPIAYVTPLWHGVELTRATALSAAPAWDPWSHIGVLVAYFGLGFVMALRYFPRRLVK